MRFLHVVATTGITGVGLFGVIFREFAAVQARLSGKHHVALYNRTLLLVIFVFICAIISTLSTPFASEKLNFANFALTLQLRDDIKQQASSSGRAHRASHSETNLVAA